MINNHTEVLCREEPVDGDMLWLGILLSVNTLSVMINCMHMFVLRKIQRLRDRSYFWILLNLTLVDTAVAISVALIVSCTRPWLQKVDYGKILGAALLVSGESSSMCRYFQLTLASLDRYYAVCRPFEYANSRLLNNIGKLSFLGWITNILPSLAQFLVAPNAICLGALWPFTTQHKYTVYIFLWGSLNMLLPSIATAILLTKAIRELKRMQKRSSSMTDDDREVKNATKYVLVTCILFYITVIPLVLLALMRTKLDYYDIYDMYLFVALCQSLYGVLNVVLFGFFNPAYVGQIKSLFRPCSATRVEPF